MTTVERPISEDEVQAYVDDQLDSARRQEVERYLATQPEIAERVAAYRAQRETLRAAFAARAAEPIPPELNLARLFEAHRRWRFAPWQVAAAVVLALGVGGAGGWYFGSTWQPNRTQLAMSLLSQEALASHTVYAADQRHPVEMAADEREHLMQWLSNRLHRKVVPPDLSAAGYHLLGGRLLATERGGAAALFVYDDDAGNRLSLLMRPMAPELSASPADMRQGAMNGSAWISKGMGYAVVAASPDNALERVTREVSQQAAAS
jgi:anti-sigma factor RsiW